MANLWDDGSASQISQLTPEMIECGVDALKSCEFGFSFDYVAEKIFRAMIVAHPPERPEGLAVQTSDANTLSESSLLKRSKLSLKLADELKSKRRELLHSWQDMLTFEGLILSETYGKVCRLKIILELHIVGASDACYVEYTPALCNQLQLFNCQTTKPDIAELDRGSGNCRDQNNVFVSNVECVDRMKRTTLVPSFVRFQHVSNDSGDHGSSLQYSVTGRKGSYAFLPGLDDFDLSFGSQCHSSYISDDFAVCVVEGGTNIVQRVTKDQWNIGGRFFGLSELQQLISGIHVTLNNQFPNAELDELVKGELKITNVFIGPFGL